jgi:hypothetical protein
LSGGNPATTGAKYDMHISSRAQLLANAVTYERAIYDDGHEVKETIPHTQAWIALYNDDIDEPRWMVVPAKFGGHLDMTPDNYVKSRRSLSGTRALAAISKLGITEIKGNHPARGALKELLTETEQAAREVHRFYVLDGEDLPRTEAVIVNVIFDMIEKQGLSREARQHIVNRMTAA